MSKKFLIYLLFLLIFLSCSSSGKKTMPHSNPVVYFEIPVTDMKRAEQFYTDVFHFHFEKEDIDGYEMSLFPFEEKNTGITGALAKGDVYKPTRDGIMIYFKTESIDESLRKVVQHKGKILYPKKINEKYGFAVAEFEDSEGNRIALHETLKND